MRNEQGLMINEQRTMNKDNWSLMNEWWRMNKINHQWRRTIQNEQGSTIIEQRTMKIEHGPIISEEWMMKNEKGPLIIK